MPSRLQILHLSNQAESPEWIALGLRVLDRPFDLRTASEQGVGTEIVLVDESLRTTWATPEGGPRIVLSDGPTPAHALSLLREGAWEVVAVGDSMQLALAVERCVRRWTAQKDAEARAEREAEHLHFALEAADMLSWELDVASRTMSYSKNLPQMAGSPDVARYQSLEAFYEQVHVDDRAHTLAAAARTVEQGERYACDYRIRLPDGSYHWVTARGGAVKDAEGRVTRVFGVTQDIHARKVAEDGLRASEERFRELFEHAHDALFVMDPRSGRFVAANPAAVTMFGAEAASELIAVEPWGLSPPLQPEGASSERLAREHVQRALDDGYRAFEWVHRRLDGTDFQADVQLVRVDDAVFATVRDVTVQRRAELALRESELRLRLAIGAAQMGTWEWDLTTGRHVWSATQERLWGYESGTFPGTTEAFLERIHPEDRERLRGAGARVRDGRESFHVAYRVVRPDGGTRSVVSFGQYLYDTQSAPSRVVGVVFDDTERSAALDALRRREAIFGSVIRQASDAIAILDSSTGRFVEFNDAAHEGLGYSREEFACMGPADIQAELDAAEIRRVDDSARLEGAASLVTKHRHRDGTLRDVRVSLRRLEIPERDYLAVVWTDVTEQLRAEARANREASRTAFLLELHQRAPAMSEQELFEYVLERAVELTRSEIGFLHRVSDDQQEVLLAAWSKRARGTYTVDIGPRYPLAEAGIWADCIRTREAVVVNDYPHAEGRHGLPEGHKPIARFVSIPVVEDGAVRIVFAVGNKPTTYDDDDVTQLQIVSNELLKLVRQRAAQTRLQESEARFRSLVESSFDWIWEVDAAGRYVYASPKVRELLGYEPEEIVGKAPFDLMPPEEAKRVGAIFAELAGRRTAVSSLVNTNLHKDGSSIVLETSAVPLLAPDGTLLGYRGNDRDITARQRVEEERARLAAAMDQAAENIMITDPAGIIVYVNPAFEKTSGWSRAEAIGQTPRILRSDQDSSAYDRLWSTLARGEVFHEHLVNRRKDGTLFEVEITISPVRDGAGKIVNFVAISLDVTRQVELEAALRQAQKLEAVGQLAGGVAHDFNNILAAMHMQLDLLGAEPSLTPALRTGLDDLAAYSNRAAELTRQLLLFSRRSALVVKILDLNAVIVNLLKMLQRIIGEDVALRFEPSTVLPSVEADASMLEQVIVNLVVNARDAMPSGGSIVLRTTTEAGGAKAERFVCLSVTDSGVGMAQETLKRIFEPFFTTKEVGKGTGLGLATVHGIVAQHRGWVDVDSEVGRGSTFRVFLPAAAAAEEASEKVRPSPELRRGQETVLLVEDDPQVRKLVSRSLQRLGYRVLEAGDGPLALEIWTHAMAAGEPIDLLLTDMVLPNGMTGLELVSRLRGEAPELRVVASSGYSVDLAQRGMVFDDKTAFLGKPYTTQALSETIRSTLDAP